MTPTGGEAEAVPGLLPPRGTFLLLALCAALLLHGLGAVPLLGPDEPRYARVAVEMHRSGDHVTPTLQGQPWLEKPILYYWLASAGFGALGEGETAARLPSVLAALLLVGATALVGARVFGAAAGLHAGFIAGTCLLTFGYGRAAAMDMLLAAFVSCGIGLLGLRALGIAGRAAVPVAGVCLGLAALAKGPLAIVLPGLVFGAWIVSPWRAGTLRLFRPSLLAAFVIVAAPWYLLVWRAQGWAFVETFFLNHNVERFTSTVHNHPGPPSYYLGVLVAGLFPWTALLLPAFGGLRPRAERAHLFLLLWLLLPLLFFSAAGSKLPGYILPCVPPLAILMGRAAARLQLGLDGAGFTWRLGATIGVVLGAVVGSAPFLLLRNGEAWQPAAPLGAWAVIVALTYSRRVAVDPVAALRTLRIGAAGLLLLVVPAATPILARRESGRSLFTATGGREVLGWGATRTAWMSGYFYNDGAVRQVRSLVEVLQSVRAGETLVIAGPAEWKQLSTQREVVVRTLATGPRGSALLHVAAAR